MPRQFPLLAITIATTSAIAQFAAAQSTTATAQPKDRFIEEIIVYGSDKTGLLETTPTENLFGIAKPLTETPRSATFVSDINIQRYGIEEVDDLISIVPGAFTASYYGVKGAVNLRGTMAETYYRGFKRIENRGTYQTSLASAESIEILRGPPTALFGPGKVGGFLNITPKSARNASGELISELGGSVEVVGGSYGKFNTSGIVSGPFELGSVEGGFSLYGEYEDSDSYYRGIHPEHKLIQYAIDLDLSDKTTFAFSGSYYDSDGYVQTPGWNRLTQELIDSGRYVTGTDTTVVDSNGDGRIDPAESGGSFVSGYFGFPPELDGRYSLDQNIGTTKLDPRDVFISDADFSESRTDTFFVELSHQLSGDVRLRAQGFYDALENERFVSYGFPASYDSEVWELRGSVDFVYDNESLALQSHHITGLSWREFDGVRRENYNLGFTALDRRDIAAGATPGDTLDDPFRNPDIGWELENNSEWRDAGLFYMGDMTFRDTLNLMLGARFDDYDLTSNDTGHLAIDDPAESNSDDDFTWNASLSLLLDNGLVPYVTYAESSAIENSQAGDVHPGLVNNGQWLSESELKEAGVKFNLFDQVLVGGLSYYEQQRTRLSSRERVVATTGEGVELELRWLIDDNFSATLAATDQETTIEGPDTGFVYVPAYAVGLDPADAAGGALAVFNLAGSYLGFPGDYTATNIPDNTVSLYGTYVSDAMSWGQAGASLGIVHVAETSTLINNPVVYPSYEVVNLSLYATLGSTQLTLNVNNLMDEDYFQPAAGSYVNTSALPGRGREWRITLKQAF